MLCELILHQRVLCNAEDRPVSSSAMISHNSPRPEWLGIRLHAVRILLAPGVRERCYEWLPVIDS
jgi:hypothetical protein